jgi:para-nitrobenzyl esterase
MKTFCAAVVTLGALLASGCSGEDTGNGGAGAGAEGPGGSGGSAAAGTGGAATGGAGAGAAGSGGQGGTPAEGLDVTIDQGDLRGYLSEGVRAFLGIPFGATTGGDARWTGPAPAPGWSGVRDATELGPPCAQLNPTGTAFDATSTEDCLTVNVWAPAGPPEAPVPVMVWIYGGAYQFGSGGPPYNAESLVSAGNVVVVTFNYRLAAMGFFAHPALTEAAQAARVPPANLGLQDQQLALRWVQDNIAAFGGDRGNVTLFGESAGANSTCLHMVSESSRGLFHRAIVQSGLCLKPMLTLAEAEAKGARYAEAMGCTDPAEVLTCLRQLDMETVLTGPATAPPRIPGGLFYQDALEQLGFQPIVDGTLVAEQPAEAIAAGRVGDVAEVLHGATTDEGALFHVPPLGGDQPADDTEYEAALANRFGAHAAEVAAQYPVSDYPSYAEALSAVTGDAIFRCPAIRMAELLHAAGRTNYLYRFHLPVTSVFEGLSGRPFHSADIPYVFGHEYLLGSVPPEHAGASAAIQGYWTRFAASGDPNGGGAPSWPVFDDAAGHLNLDSPMSAGSDWRADGCDFWDAIAIVPF